MRKLPDFFDEQEIAIVESGEQTGMIQKAFLSIAEDLRAQEDLHNKIVSAMTYPLIILVFLSIALMIVFIYVIPQLLPILTGTIEDLPWSTRSLIATSTFFRENFLFILLI